MKFDEDPRIKVARKSLVISWVFYFIYLAAVMASSYLLGTKPYLLGLPRWVAVGNIFIPVLFVIMVIFVAEKFIPDIPLTDNDKNGEEEE